MKNKKSKSYTAINWWSFPENDNYRENENNSIKQKGISTKKKNPYVYYTVTEIKTVQQYGAESSFCVGLVSYVGPPA